MKEILTIVGARPQFVKAAVFSRYLNKNATRLGLSEYLVHTGQHYDDNMSEIFFREMEIPTPDVNLNIGSGSHGKMTGEMLWRIEEIILDRSPDIVLVYGDTNSTLAGALAAAKLHIPVAHIEAGLRSFMMVMPEEQNRRLTDQLSTWLLCPTATAITNLKAEGIQDTSAKCPSSDKKRVTNVGDIMFEASLYYRRKALEGCAGGPLSGIVSGKTFALLTLHRAENTDDPRRLLSIVTALNCLDNIEFVFPVHPRTRKIMTSLNIKLANHIKKIEPVGYFDMIRLEEECDFVITDSGGVQKEAFFFGKPCITLRDSTEWVELVDSGWNTTTGADTDRILTAVQNLRKPVERPPLYGDGNCAEKIVHELMTGVES